jgi:hypothetical protein
MTAFILVTLEGLLQNYIAMIFLVMFVNIDEANNLILFAEKTKSNVWNVLQVPRAVFRDKRHPVGFEISLRYALLKRNKLLSKCRSIIVSYN